MEENKNVAVKKKSKKGLIIFTIIYIIFLISTILTKISFDEQLNKLEGLETLSSIFYWIVEAIMIGFCLIGGIILIILWIKKLVSKK